MPRSRVNEGLGQIDDDVLDLPERPGERDDTGERHDRGLHGAGQVAELVDEERHHLKHPLVHGEQHLTERCGRVLGFGGGDALGVGEAVRSASEVALGVARLGQDLGLRGEHAGMLIEGALAVVQPHRHRPLLQRGVIEQHAELADRFGFAAQRSTDRFDRRLGRGVVERRQVGREPGQVGGEPGQVLPGQPGRLAERRERRRCVERGALGEPELLRAVLRPGGDLFRRVAEDDASLRDRLVQVRCLTDRLP